MKTINGHRALTLASLLGMLGAFAGCGAPTPGASTPDAGALAPTTRGTGMTVMLRVGPEGGTIALESVSLTVPPGALTSAQTLSVTSSMEAPPEGHAPYSPVFRFEPEGITFARPVAVRFTAGSGATDPVIYWTRPGSGEFEELGGVFEGGVVRGEVTHFSRGFAARRRAALADGGARDVPAALDAVPGDIPAPTDAPAEDVACTVAGTRYCGVGVGCVSIYNNDLHCGGCGNACVAGQYCAIADCVTRPADAAVPDAPGDGGGACPAPLSACGTDCRNLTSDRNHCGACGNVCPVMGPGLTTRCTDGLCGAQCGEFVRNCDGDLTNGCEVRVDADTANCGGCDVACASGQTCRLGACAGGDGGGVDAPSTDVGAVDARTDVGPTDAGSMDVRTADAGTLDAGTLDAGTLDAGTADVRPIDAGTADSGPADSGPVDSGPVDSGPADGACGGATPDRCGGACVDLRRDVNHCGACGASCLPRGPNETSYCEGSVCNRPCRPYFAECDGAPATICETDVGTSNANCGSCGTVCAAGLSCVAGACRCPAGRTLCGGACVDMTTDRSHCGACGRACTAAQACTAGVCAAATCSAPTVSCAGACAYTTVDPTNCGACGTACTSTQYCNMSACVACAAGRVRCSNAAGSPCVDPQTNALHCGACGNACAAAYAGGEGFCAAGACGTRCRAFYGDCDGSLANGCEVFLMSDPANCGACGNACPAGQRCVETTCMP